MTVIVGVTDRDGVWIGGDAYLGSDGCHRAQPEPKTFRRGEFLIGASGEPRFGQLLQHQLKVPERGRMGREAFMVGPFVDAIRVLLKAKGYAKTDNGREGWDSVSALVGFEGRLWVLWGDLQIGPVRDYAAVGAGMDTALGALHASGSLAPSLRVRAALRAADAHCGYVCPPFKVMHQPRP